MTSPKTLEEEKEELSGVHDSLRGNMTSPKKAEWEEELREFAGNLKLQNHVIHHGRFPIGETPQEDEAICVYCGANADKIIQFVRQTHTDLLTTLKERVEGISKDISDPYPFDNGYTYAPFVPLSDILTLIDSLLVTDEKV